MLIWGAGAIGGTLCLTVDCILPERVAVEAAGPLGVPVFPVVPYGVTPLLPRVPRLDLAARRDAPAPRHRWLCCSVLPSGSTARLSCRRLLHLHPVHVGNAHAAHSQCALRISPRFRLPRGSAE